MQQIKKYRATLYCALLLIVTYIFLNSNYSLMVNSAEALGNVGDRVLSGEFYRLFTAIWLENGSLLALISNLILLLLSGFLIEPTLGSKRFTFIFLVTGVLAFLLADVTVKILVDYFYTYSRFDIMSFSQPLLGASGAITGILGSGIILISPKEIPQMTRRKQGILVILNFFILVSVIIIPLLTQFNISDLTHIYGFISGAAIAFILSRRNNLVVNTIKRETV
ncbi:rhomboid family intramembrane serine protease [Lapidilactobacillus bayanensis]|uniref:rhomboid family intramembrane serine protease n=1 Tax=Lapidilactobacillus bayanensis TaxID=2485998 RepID=UPI000F76B3CD|nr:rhomboid family intramembrane serine protease [Lapidilactobacillus bayanensis]